MLKIFHLLLIALISGQVFAKTFNVNLDSDPTVKREENIFYSFGQVPLNQLQSVDLKVTNDGAQNMTFGKSIMTGGYFYADTDCPEVLQPGRHCVFRVSFYPTLAGLFYGGLTVNFTNRDVINLELDGTAVAR